ncbi:hypothetical protein FOA52_003777 [Chlamydomonas sp. UWO 241]|nr:hypothetical protein FOA52_003777 [Chlamydomonas sp. UWO 241]
MYDEGHFKREMRKASVIVVSENVAPQPHEYLNIDASRLGQFADVDHVSIQCPLFSLQIQPNEDTLLWSVLDALVPAPWAQAFVSSMLTAAHGANFLHLRIERDWLEHCRTWPNQGDGIVRDNCMNNSDTMDTVLPSFGFKTDVPLLVETYWDDVNPQSVEMQAVTRLIDQGYQVRKAEDIFHRGTELDR